MAESWALAHGKETGAGARIAIFADNHPRWVAAYLGSIASGYAAVPLDTAFHADQVTKLLKDSGAALLVCDVKTWRSRSRRLPDSESKSCLRIRQV